MFFFYFLFSSCHCDVVPLILHYDKSASDLKPSAPDDEIWSECSLPIGNGHVGANFFGEVINDKLTINDEALHNGGPSKKQPDYNNGNVPNAGKDGETARLIRDAWERGDRDTALKLQGQIVGDKSRFGMYQPLGTIFMTYDMKDFDKSKVKNYNRYLDIDYSVGGVTFEYEGVKYNREYFISFPDDVLMIRLNSSQSNKLNLTIHFATPHPNTLNITDTTYEIGGELSDNNMRFFEQIKVQLKNGNSKKYNNKIIIENADEVIIYSTTTTDYKQIHPHYRTGEAPEEVAEKCRKIINKAYLKGFDKIRMNHIEDYRRLFTRNTLDLGQLYPDVPTNVLLEQMREGKNKDEYNRYSEVLVYQYGRYLTISGSRDGNQLPTNLQGIWNDKIDPSWNSDFHLDENLEMNYWPTYPTDLHECALPLVDYVQNISIPGKITNKVYFGTDLGFSGHICNNAFGHTAPNGASVFYWMWVSGSTGWILQNVYDYYRFTNDEKILKERIYPMMRDIAQFYKFWAKPQNKTSPRLIICPAQSPEQPNWYSDSCAFEQQIMHQHLATTIQAAKVLNVDSELIPVWEKLIEDMMPAVDIGESGQVREWYCEGKLGSMGQPQHRHISHLLALFPFDLISTDTPTTLAAAIISLIDRGDLATGWATAHRLNAWARTGDGNHAFSILHQHIMDRLYINLWDFHPPFQIDGNFGLTSGVCEMLLQSNMGYLNILPSLPDNWTKGSFEGMIGRGNFQVNVTWNNSKIVTIHITSRSGNQCVIKSKNIAQSRMKTRRNTKIEIISEDKISFETEIGGVYSFDFKDVVDKDIKFEEAESKTTRISSRKAKIDLSEMKREGIRINIYKSIGNNKPILIATDVKGESFIDENSYKNDEVPDTKYFIETIKEEGKQINQMNQMNQNNQMNQKSQKNIIILSISIVIGIIVISIIGIISKKKHQENKDSYEQIGK